MTSRSTRAKRKLIPYKLFLEIYHRFTVNVPVARIINDFELDISSPCLKNLLKSFHIRNNKTEEDFKVIMHSLFPPWLDESLHQVQESPSDWKYCGRFPNGKWEKE